MWRAGVKVRRYVVARSKSSQKWLKEHFKDPFVQRAMKEGYRSRASYKLLEIQQKDHLIRPGMRVLDVGAAPGGWTQVAAPLIGKKGRLVAVDRLAMDPVADAIVICGDVYEDAVLAACRDALPGGADLIMSDMAPNMSGIASVDQARAIDLAELALDMAQRWLVPGGSLLIKVFMGSGAEDLRRALRRDFKKIVVRKPEASRARSTEQYWLALDFQRVAQERLDNGGASSL
nr:SAM-dependent methyltransferase [Acidithiobacillus ferriphilus]